MQGAIPIERLDELLVWFDAGRISIGIDEAYKRYSEVWMTHPRDLPEDPFSSEYAARYFEIYQRIAARATYDPAVNERAEFDPVEGANRPFPFQGGSTKLAGEHFGYMARLLDMMDVPPGAEILEMGVGWGNTTLALAMLDFKVTALDIEERYLEVVRLRAEMHKTSVECVHSDFLWVERTDRQFDAVIFFESFHHCLDFQRLLRALHRVVKPGGKVYFAAEPINEQFEQPWCVRLDGQSLLVARRNGWMELGFRSDFFATLLRRTGWIGMESDHPHFWSAHRASEPLVFSASDPRVSSHTGRREAGGLHVVVPGGEETRSYAVFGPNVRLPSGRYRGVIDIAVEGSLASTVIDVCCDQGRKILGTRLCATELEFDLSSPADDIQIRLVVPGGFVGTVRHVSFQPID